MTSAPVNLDKLPSLDELFRWFNSGKHLNRQAEPALWVELDNNLEAYKALFSALGYELRLDERGFAWFHTEEASGTTSKTTRQLALLFMMIFDTQADAGKALLRFDEWRLDTAFLHQLMEQHQSLLEAEGLDQEGLKSLLDAAVRFGFAQYENGHWRLLPAVCRYLDHFEALADHHHEQARADTLYEEDTVPETNNAQDEDET
ncbi:MAG: hypothetical protein LAT62_11825 [Natronospirillum sp.]|uniref:condensin complex protein MksE n=1 Tax=Natronospirillum sp. TaxID=2812955 RepID=UPI0025D91427|nr:hypothetical protein [Natronospirillum sp.]MCH8552620.1 hypothetical protein [Natronospirillum sp.]